MHGKVADFFTQMYTNLQICISVCKDLCVSHRRVRSPTAILTGSCSSDPYINFVRGSMVGRSAMRTTSTTVPTDTKKHWWHANKNVLLIIGCLLIVLALGLGLGLGLGLKDHGQSGTTAVNNTQSSILQDPQEYILDPKWNLTTPNTTRYYVFNITEIPDGAPDGVPKRMFLVNGKYPGPRIEGNQGDRLILEVNNFMTVPTAIHFHGQFQNGDWVLQSSLILGTAFMDGTNGVTQCGIPPNTSFTYNFTMNPAVCFLI